MEIMLGCIVEIAPDPLAGKTIEDVAPAFAEALILASRCPRKIHVELQRLEAIGEGKLGECAFDETIEHAQSHG